MKLNSGSFLQALLIFWTDFRYNASLNMTIVNFFQLTIIICPRYHHKPQLISSPLIFIAYTLFSNCHLTTLQVKFILQTNNLYYTACDCESNALGFKHLRKYFNICPCARSQTFIIFFWFIAYLFKIAS